MAAFVWAVLQGMQTEIAQEPTAWRKLTRSLEVSKVLAAEVVTGAALMQPVLKSYLWYRKLPSFLPSPNAPHYCGVRVEKDIRFYSNQRTLLDVYVPHNPSPNPTGTTPHPTSPPTTHDPSAPVPHVPSSPVQHDPSSSAQSILAPVIMFCHGGIWSTGEKWQFAAMATRLAQAGIVVVVVQYTLYPEAVADEMAEEVSEGITWTLQSVERYGGDPTRVTVVGHSAGAHLTAMALLIRARAAYDADMASRGHLSHSNVPCDHPNCLPAGAQMPACFIGMSGVYDLPVQYEIERMRKVNNISTLCRANGGLEGLVSNSPAILLASAACERLPAQHAPHAPDASEAPHSPSSHAVGISEAASTPTRASSTGPQTGTRQGQCTAGSCMPNPGSTPTHTSSTAPQTGTQYSQCTAGSCMPNPAFTPTHTLSTGPHTSTQHGHWTAGPHVPNPLSPPTHTSSTACHTDPQYTQCTAHASTSNVTHIPPESHANSGRSTTVNASRSDAASTSAHARYTGPQGDASTCAQAGCTGPQDEAQCLDTTDVYGPDTSGACTSATHTGPQRHGVDDGRVSKSDVEVDQRRVLGSGAVNLAGEQGENDQVVALRERPGGDSGEQRKRVLESGAGKQEENRRIFEARERPSGNIAQQRSGFVESDMSSQGESPVSGVRETPGGDVDMGMLLPGPAVPVNSPELALIWGLRSLRTLRTQNRIRSSDVLKVGGLEAYFSSFELEGEAIPVRCGLHDPHAVTALRGELSRSAQGWLPLEAARKLPPCVVMSSCEDHMVPWHEGAQLVNALEACGVPARHLIYQKIGHNDFIFNWHPNRQRLPGLALQHSTAGLEPFGRDMIKIVQGGPAMLQRLFSPTLARL